MERLSLRITYLSKYDHMIRGRSHHLDSLGFGWLVPAIIVI